MHGFISSYITLVRHNRNYRYLWFSQVVSQMGDWFNLIASAALVANLNGSGLAIGGLFLARLLPPFLLGPLAGVIADRFDRRKIMITSDLLRMLVVLAFLLVRTEQDVWLIYTLTVLQLSISAFYDPARQAILPSLVSKKDLVTANTLGGITWSVMLAVGAGLGGLATALLGVTASFIIDSLTFVVSAWLVTRLVLPQAVTQNSHSAGPDVGWQAFVAGLRYLQQHPAVLVVALLKGSVALASGGMTVTEVTFANEIFPLGDDGSGTLGLILFTTGVGAAIGPLVARRITGDNLRAMHWAVLAAMVALVSGYLTIGLAPTLLAFLVATFIRGVGGSINWVYSSSMLQMMVPDRYLGRVFAFDIAMFTLGSALSTLWAGWASDTLGLSPYEIALALAVVPFVIAISWLLYLNLRFKRQKLFSA